MKDGNLISEERDKTGKLLYKFAWAVEVVAILIGLLIALLTFMESRESGSGSILNALVGAIPLFMIALVEATKIPFVEAFYRITVKAWKITFGVTLLILSFITFETFFNGLERYFAQLLNEINSEYNTLNRLDEEIIKNEEQIDILNELTKEKILSNYEIQRLSAIDTFTSQEDAIKDRISSLRSSVSSASILDYEKRIQEAQIEVKEEKIAGEKRVDQLQQKQLTNIANLKENFNAKTESDSLNLNRQRQDLVSLRSTARAQEKDAPFYRKNDVRELYREKIRKLEEKIEKSESLLSERDLISVIEKQDNKNSKDLTSLEEKNAQKIARLRSRLSGLIEEKNERTALKENDIKPLLDNLSGELNSISNAFNSEMDLITAAKDSEEERYQKKQEKIEILEDKMLDLKDERVEIRDVINAAVADNNIYRIAMFFTQKKSAADISRQLAQRVAAIWFGSIAFLCAYTGVMLALASFVLRDNQIPDKKQEKNSNTLFYKTLRTIRLAFFSIRKKRKTIINEVIKEIPVEKLVYRDVPVEITRKELVHVPLWTSDKRKIKFSFQDDADGDQSKDKDKKNDFFEK